MFYCMRLASKGDEQEQIITCTINMRQSVYGSPCGVYSCFYHTVLQK